MVGGNVMPVMSVPKFERFFRIAAGLDIDKADLKRYSDFVNRKMYDLLIRGAAAAKANPTVRPACHQGFAGVFALLQKH
jgi:hypothetical protein